MVRNFGVFQVERTIWYGKSVFSGWDGAIGMKNQYFPRESEENHEETKATTTGMVFSVFVPVGSYRYLHPLEHWSGPFSFLSGIRRTPFFYYFFILFL